MRRCLVSATVAVALAFADGDTRAADYCVSSGPAQISAAFLCSDAPLSQSATIGRWVELRFEEPQRIRRITIGADCRGANARRHARIAALRIETGDGLVLDAKLLDQAVKQVVALPRWSRTSRIRATIVALHREGTACLVRLEADLEEQSALDTARQACEAEENPKTVRRCLETHLARLERELTSAFNALIRQWESMDLKAKTAHADNWRRAQDAWMNWRNEQCRAAAALEQSGFTRFQKLGCLLDTAETRLWQLRESLQ